MKIYKRVLSLVIALALIVGMIPMSAITAHAIGEVLQGTYYAEAGETTTVTCRGGAIWQQTHFSISGFGIGKVTKYDSDGTVEFEKDIFGSYSYSKTSCVADEQFVFDMYYGSIEIYFTTSNVGYPALEKVANNQSLNPPVKLNENPLYLTLGESQELFIEWTQPTYESQVISYSSNNTKVATVSEDGVVTSHCEGEAEITVKYYFIRPSDEKALSMEVKCPVTVVDDVVDKNTGLRFYYSDEEIEPGETVQIGASYSYGDFTGMYYPGKVEWKVSNPDVLKIVQTVDNITMVRVEALAMGKCDLSLVLDGVVKCTETIDVTITDDTLISMYKDYLMDCAVMTTLADARNTCWDVVERYSSGNRARIAFMTCLKSDLGLSVITKEAAAAVGLSSSTHDDTVDEAVDLLMAELFSSEEAAFSDGLSTFKKRFKAFGAFTKTTSFTGGSVASILSQFTSFSEQQIKGVEGLANGFIGDGITMAELVSGAVMTVQYERDVVVSLMNTVASAPGGTSSDLYKGLERLLFEMDNLELYVAARYLNNEMVDGLKDLIKDGLFSKDAKIFNKTIWNVASGMGYLISRAYANEGGIFADDYMKACITAGFAGTLCNVVKNSDNAMQLEYSFKFYVASVKVALGAAIDICEDAAVNCLDLKYIAEGYLNQIDSTCTYENLLEQCRRAVINASDFKSNVYMEDGEIVVDAYWELPDTNALMLTDDEAGSFYDTSYTSDQLIIVPSHINGEKVTGIAANGFKGIANKYGIVLPNSVVKIGDYAFSDCPQVTFVVIGGSLKEIGSYAFNNNYALQAIKLPDCLETIKEGAFNNCYNITSVITNAARIDTKAFNNCKALASVTIKNRNAVISEDAFDNCNSSLTIYGYKDTAAEEIATAKGYTFVELSETVSSIEIITPATKTEYEVGEDIDTAGMTLKVTYMDGTSETVDDGWVAYGNTTKAGSATVKVYYDDKSATYDITVTEPVVSSVELEDTSLTLLYGTDKQLSASVLPSTSKNVKIVWSTNNPNVATVDANGYVEAVGTGSAVITATVLDDDISANCAVTVVDSKEIDPSVSNQDYITFTARENGYYVFYSVNGQTGATGSILDINGNTLYSNGGTNFRVEGQLHKDKTYILKTSSNSDNGIFQVVINKSVDADNVYIVDNEGNDLLGVSGYPGDQKTLYVNFSPVNYISETCTWESNDTTIATVNEQGVVSFVAPGNATITVTSENGLTDTCTVVVKQFTDCEELTFGEAKTIQLSEVDKHKYFKFTPEESGWYVFYTDKWVRFGNLLDAEGNYINGSSSYSSPVRVENELVAGETYVFKVGYVYSYDTMTEPFNLYVKDLNYAESISIEQGESLTRYPNASIWLEYTFEPDTDIIPESVTWASSDTSVATVSSSGYVYTKKAGITTISITSSNGLTDELELTVIDYPEIHCDEQISVVIDDTNNLPRYKFVPEETGWYALKLITQRNVYCPVYDATGSRLEVSGTVFDECTQIGCELQQGETYFFAPQFSQSNLTGNFDIKLEKMIAAESVQIESEDGWAGYLGHTINLSASFLPEGCIKESLTWESSDETIATVDANGAVKLLAVGEVDITVTTANGLTDSCAITITEYPIIVAGEVTTVTIERGDDDAYFRFTPEKDGIYSFRALSSDFTCAYLNDSDGNRLDYDNTSGDGRPFKVEATLTAGETYVLRCGYYSSSTTGSFDIKVVEVVDAEEVRITNGDTYTGQINSNYQLTAELIPDGARDEELTWTSSNSSIVSVNSSGYINLLEEGTAEITVTSASGLTDSITVEVTGYPSLVVDQGIVVTTDDNSGTAWFTFEPSVTATYSFFSYDNDFDTYGHLYDSDMNQITSNDDGGNGNNFKISYKLIAGEKYYFKSRPYSSYSTGSYSVKITILPAASSMEIGNGDTLSAYVGDNKYLWVQFSPDGCATENVTWTSDDTSIVTVDQYGNLALIGVGTTTVTATSENGLTDSISITVKAVSEIQLDSVETVEIATGGETKLYTFTPTETDTYNFKISGDYYKRIIVYTTSTSNNVLNTSGYEINRSVELTANTTYRILTYYEYSDQTGTYTLNVSKAPDATSLTITNGPSVSGYVGDTRSLYTEFGPEGAVNETVTWESNNTNIATVDQYGQVSLLAVGTATITATSENGLVATCVVEVMSIPTIVCDETKVLTGDVNGASGLFSFVPTVDGTYAFYSFDANTATYGEILDADMEYLTGDWYGSQDEYYSFKAVYEMTAGTQYYLTSHTPWSSNGAEYSVKIVLLVPATSVNIIPDGDINIFEGYEYRVDAELDPENSIDEALTWTSSNPSVATIDNDGNITALTAGTSTITVTTENGLTDSITVTVHAPEEIELNETKDTTITSEIDRNVFSFTPSEDGQYIIKISGDYYTQTSVQDSEMNWINSNSGYYYSFKVSLSADENYRIATVLWDEAESGEYSITIEKLVPATSLEITQEGTDGGYVGDYGYLYTNFGPENAIEEEITWVSSNPEVAVIESMYDSSYIRVNFVSAGTTTITATSTNGLTDTIVITVAERPSLTSIEIGNGDSLTGYVGIAKYLWVNFYPDGAAHEQLTWSSDNEAVATVNEEGKVELLTTGTVNITVVSESGFSDTCTITVTEIQTLTTEQSVQITVVDNEEQYVKFVPTESGLFRIYVSDFSNDNKARITLRNANMEWLTDTWDDTFLDYEFEVGETYYIETNYRSYSGSGNGIYNLNVVKPVPATSISFDIGSEYNGYVGTSRYVNVIYAPDHAITESITWSSTDSSIVSVNRYGEITLNAVGTATITATSENGLVYSCVITVEDFETIEVGQEKDVVLDGDEAYFYFTPDEDGYYSFYSYDNDHDTYGYILNSDMEIITSDDDGGDGNNFKVKYQLEAGVTYVLKARFFNTENSGSFKVCVEQTKYVTALEIVSLPEKTEYVEGFVNADNINYYGLKLKVTWSDGTTTDWKYNYDWSVDGEYIYRDASNIEETGVVELTCGEASVSLTLTIIENPVDHIEIVSGTEISYVENYNGYVDENGDGEFFYYHTNYPYDAVIRIVYKDGTSKTAKVGESVNDYSISWEHNQHEEPWVVGTNNKSLVTYLGHTVVLPITVKENTVTGIEVVSGKVTCIENAYGYEMDNGYYYYYNMPSDVTLKISYADGSSKVVGINEVVDGYHFNWDTDQYETPWVLGDNNYLTVSYLGSETQLPVSIITSPVERIVINSAPTREYVYGDTTYGYLYSDGEYEFYPTDLSGLSFTVYYVDGTNKTFTAEDINEFGDINGYGYELYYDEYNAQIGDFPVQFMYMGKTANYTVVLKESTVSSIAITKQPNRVEYNNLYAPDFIGMEITITYTDETTKVVTLTEDNLVYEYNPGWGELSYVVDVDGYNLTIEPYYGEDMYYVASYLGAQCDIDDIIFADSKEIDSIELDNVSSNGDGMTVEVTYTDESTETLTLELVEFFDYEDSSGSGYGMTANGLLYYYIETYTDDTGKPEKYRVYIFNEEITVEADAVVIGDVNGDGAVDNLDRLAITRYLADWDGYNESDINMAAADVNNDGSVDNLDRLALTRHLANWEGYEELPVN